MAQACFRKKPIPIYLSMRICNASSIQETLKLLNSQLKFDILQLKFCCLGKLPRNYKL